MPRRVKIIASFRLELPTGIEIGENVCENTHKTRDVVKSTRSIVQGSEIHSRTLNLNQNPLVIIFFSIQIILQTLMFL